MELTIKFTEKEMNRFLSYSGMAYNELSELQKSKICMRMKEGIESRMNDDPHYVYEDYIEGLL